MLLKNYFDKFKKCFIQKKDSQLKRDRDIFVKRESLFKKDFISASEAILRKKFERNMQQLFNKYKNV
jgi:hypothetical protein